MVGTNYYPKFGLTELLGSKRPGLSIAPYLLALDALGTTVAWWDFTDPSNQFQENTGPTAADDATESIGLKLDQALWGGKTLSQELAGQSELFDFAAGSTSGWTAENNATLSTVAGALRITGDGVTNFPKAKKNFAATSGALYRVTFSYSRSSGATTYLNISANGTGNPSTFTQSNDASGTLAAYVVATGSAISVQPVGTPATSVVDILSVSCKLVPGYPATQSTAGSKPTVQAGFVVRGDGVDDNLVTALNPATSMTLIEVGTPDSGSAGDVLIGSQPASDGKAYLALDSNGYLAGGVGTQTTATIVDAGAVDIRSTRCAKAIRWNGTTVSLFLKPAGGAFRKAYEAAQSGAVNTTVAMYLMALNNNGSVGAAADTDSEHFMVIGDAVSDSKIAQIFNSLL